MCVCGGTVQVFGILANYYAASIQVCWQALPGLHNWDYFLEPALWAHGNSPTKTTGKQPFKNIRSFKIHYFKKIIYIFAIDKI